VTARKRQSTRHRATAAPVAAVRAPTLSLQALEPEVVTAILLPLTTFSILCYEIILTRVYAYIFTYRLTALAVSFAVFGLGAGAYVRVRWLSALPQRQLAAAAHLGTSAALLALYVTLLFTHAPLLVIPVSALPFVCAGMAVSHYYEARRAEGAAVTYALDLTGAAAGCLGSVWLLVGAGADGVVLIVAGLSAAAAALAVTRAPSPRRRAGLLAAALAMLVPVAAGVFRAQWPDPLLNRHSSLDKQLPRVLREHGAVVDTAWSAVGRADLYETPNDPNKFILTDATNSAVLLDRRASGLPDLFAYVPYAIAPVHSALILGSGAGLEVRLGREAGVASIDAVELNDAIIRLVQRWRTFAGPVYEAPGVTLFVEEGRQFLLARQRRYDVIQMSLVLTATAQSGTYALAESYLYTREAFRSYLDHLNPSGALVMIDDTFERTLKNTVTAVATMERDFGLRSDEAMQRVAVAFNPRTQELGYKYLLLVSPTPLSAERIRRLAAEAAQRPFDLLWLPGVAATPKFQALSAAGSATVVRVADLNMEPPTDDCPYLNNFAKTPAEFVILLRPYIILSALMLVVLLAMVAAAGTGAGATGRAPTVLAALYGVGFMLMELGLLHKLALAVGGPTAVLSVLLFGLLLWCGLGALLLDRFAHALRARIGSPALAVAVAGIATGLMLERWYRLDGVVPPLRLACVLAMVAPLGLCLGAPFPDLLRGSGRTDARRLASLWAVNGVGSVLGGALTLMLLPIAGGQSVFFAGSTLYVVAWLIDRRTDGGTSVPAVARQSARR
jgi:hypothetical protein